MKQIGDDKHSFNVEWKGKKLNWNLIGRALYKIGLGMVAFKEGRERACESKFDPAREFIRTGRGIENNLVVRTKFQPHPSIQTLYLDIPEGTPVFIDLFGFAFFLNLENGRAMQVDEEMSKYHFELVSLAA